KRLSYLLTLDESLKLLYLQKPSKIASILRISLNKANVIYQSLHSLKLIKQIKAESVDTYIITYFDPHYPTQLKTIPDPPYVIYAKGNIHLLKEKKMLSVIGTRKPTIQGKSKVNHFIKPLIENNWIIVSGMARGLDTYTKPERYHFPERNRIISGLSKGTIVVESGERSGTLITVDQALEQGKEVYVVPGNLFSKQTLGNNKLIQQGGKLILNASDIEEDF